MSQKPDFSKVIVIFCIATVLVFTTVVLYLSALMIPVPAAMIYTFMGFFGTEVIALAGIKVKNIQRQMHDQYHYYGKGKGDDS